MENVYVFYIASICIHGKELLRKIYIPSKYRKRYHNETDVLTFLKSWYPNNQMRSMEQIQLTGRILHGNNYLWSVMKKSSVSCTRRFTYFQILNYVLERWTRTHCQTLHGKTDWRDSRVHQNTEHMDKMIASQWNSSGIFSQDSPHCSSATKSKSSCLKWANYQNNFKDGSSSCWCWMTSHGDLKTIEQECDANAIFVSIHASWFSPGRLSFLGPGSEKEWYSTHDSKPQWEWIRIAELMMINSVKADTQFSVPRVPLSRGVLKSKGSGKLSILFFADGETIETVFSYNQFC